MVLTITWRRWRGDQRPGPAVSAVAAASTFANLLPILTVMDGQLVVGPAAQYAPAATASPSGGGTTDPAVGVQSYASGDVVNVTATPAAGCRFSSWSRRLRRRRRLFGDDQRRQDRPANFTAVRCSTCL